MEKVAEMFRGQPDAAGGGGGGGGVAGRGAVSGGGVRGIVNFVIAAVGNIMIAVMLSGIKPRLIT